MVIIDSMYLLRQFVSGATQCRSIFLVELRRMLTFGFSEMPSGKVLYIVFSKLPKTKNRGKRLYHFVNAFSRSIIFAIISRFEKKKNTGRSLFGNRIVVRTSYELLIGITNFFLFSILRT